MTTIPEYLLTMLMNMSLKKKLNSMLSLKRTKRCRLFEKCASDTWNHIIGHHGVGIQENEPGRTNDIVAEIRKNSMAYPNIGVWANPGYREIQFGSDMDIFVETEPGNFVWWALQAKVLRLNGNYEGVSTLRGGEYQWDKLNRLKSHAGCEVRYLLYNGVDNYKFNGIDYCNRSFSEEQFGCSLVSTNDMERIALQNTPRFEDFHPENAQPWRIITCCRYSNTKENTTLFSTSQIKKAVSYYPEMRGDEGIFKEQDNDETINDLPLDVINKSSNLIERKPPYRLVIRTTASLTK